MEDRRAILCGGEAARSSAVRRSGRSGRCAPSPAVGAAFQIRDDLLDGAPLRARTGQDAGKRRSCRCSARRGPARCRRRRGRRRRRSIYRRGGESGPSQTACCTRRVEKARARQPPAELAAGGSTALARGCERSIVTHNRGAEPAHTWFSFSPAGEQPPVPGGWPLATSLRSDLAIAPPSPHPPPSGAERQRARPQRAET
jgi:hypothetical protein